MLSPTFLSRGDRNRLVEINQSLLASHSIDEGIELRAEQQAIMGKKKIINECTYNELQELRQELFDNYQKHATIGSKQTKTLAHYIQQVEQRAAMILSKRVEEPTKPDEPFAKPAINSAKPSDYSWDIPMENID